eukprot:TRINITY_DN645_c0_g1_i4.p3 TRINITY_DN645_c0_g1~~TRINITY_DN645_c0_g1_i4.p3  ORF type:complete len:193 (-),score=8.97 TRINITY_DN645_c0_g1_i4:1790-2368(-)
MGNSTGSIADNRLLPLADLALPRLLVPSKAVLSFVRTKIWVVPSKGAPGFISGPADPHWASAGVVQFRHSGATGDKQLIVNGQLISKSCDLLDGGDNIPFLIGDISCRVEVLAFPGLTGSHLTSCTRSSAGGGRVVWWPSPYLLQCLYNSFTIPFQRFSHAISDVSRPDVVLCSTFDMSHMSRTWQVKLEYP